MTRKKRGRPRGSRESGSQTLLKHYEQDRKVVSFVHKRRTRGDQPLKTIIQDAAERFGRHPRTVERILKRWRRKPEGLPPEAVVSLLNQLSPQSLQIARANVLRFLESGERQAREVNKQVKVIYQEFSERELADLREWPVPRVLELARLLAAARNKKKKSTTK